MPDRSDPKSEYAKSVRADIHTGITMLVIAGLFAAGAYLFDGARSIIIPWAIAGSIVVKYFYSKVLAPWLKKRQS